MSHAVGGYPGTRVKLAGPDADALTVIRRRLIWVVAVLLVVGAAAHAIVAPGNDAEGLYALAALPLLYLIGRRVKGAGSPPWDGSGPWGPP